MVQFLLESGGSAHIKNVHGKTAADLATALKRNKSLLLLQSALSKSSGVVKLKPISGKPQRSAKLKRAAAPASAGSANSAASATGSSSGWGDTDEESNTPKQKPRARKPSPRVKSNDRVRPKSGRPPVPSKQHTSARARVVHSSEGESECIDPDDDGASVGGDDKVSCPVRA